MADRLLDRSKKVDTSGMPKMVDTGRKYGYDPNDPSTDALPPNPLAPIVDSGGLRPRPCSVVFESGEGCPHPAAWVDTVERTTLCVKHAAFINDLPASRSARWAQLELVAGHLAGLSAKAVMVLSDLLDDPDVPSAVRLKAATEVLDRTGLGKSSSIVVSTNDEEVVSAGADMVRSRLEKLAHSQNVIPLHPEATGTEE